MHLPRKPAKIKLPEGLLDELVAELDSRDVAGIVLGGSHVRGTATALSDVDLAVFVQERTQTRPRRYFYRRGLLISVATKSLPGVRADLLNPQMAVRVVPGLAGARVLLDKNGSIARLISELEQFSWAPLQGRANVQVSALMYGFVEAVHKLANELLKGNQAGVAYTVDKVVDALTEAVVLFRGVMIQGDSTYFLQAEQAAGEDSVWSRCHRRAAGLGGEVLEERATASLRLYGLTLDLVRSAITGEHAPVVEEAARLVSFTHGG